MRPSDSVAPWPAFFFEFLTRSHRVISRVPVTRTSQRWRVGRGAGLDVPLGRYCTWERGRARRGAPGDTEARQTAPHTKSTKRNVKRNHTKDSQTESQKASQKGKPKRKAKEGQPTGKPNSAAKKPSQKGSQKGKPKGKPTRKAKKESQSVNEKTCGLAGD